MVRADGGAGEYDLHWGELHKHMTGPGADLSKLDEVVGYARQHLDVSVVQCYPFKWYRRGREGGIREESTGYDAEFEDWWETIQAVSERHHDPGSFVTFPAYEWNGNRTRWGDHNVYYREEGYPLDCAWELPTLLENMGDRDAFVLPHHTAYEVGNRGKVWDVHDPDLSPVTEVYSSHGSSESIDSPVSMEMNRDMGPRTHGGTFQDALDRGHRIGAVASNDGPGLPGTWGNGVAGLWATELTRDGIWEALEARRTIGTTGDRISLWWSLDGHPLGSEVREPVSRNATVDVDCPRALDRVEIVHDGDVVETYLHDDPADQSPERYRMLIEFGWGPSPEYGDFESLEASWSGSVRATGGRLTAVQPRFKGFGQEYVFTDGECRFDLVTSREDVDGMLPELDADRSIQGFIVEIDGDVNTDIEIALDDRDALVVSLGDVFEDDTLFSFTEESQRRLESTFELSAEDVHNPDVVYHNARKVRCSRAVPRSACTATVTFDDLPATDGDDYYYVRAAQQDGQFAWASPIWVTDGPGSPRRSESITTADRTRTTTEK
ncbi:DUF3604 domain-containing protein [Halorubrum rubrum]|uniref:DUF3604 domain-containing protein n=1 Tax=Halorubrum rubrum TaxID=1126240 RepID=A0ABD5QZU0_9EURY